MPDDDAVGGARMRLLKAPFPWFGGKSRVAHLVWDALGNTPNYIEPFFGSGAVLLQRPHKPGVETVNDLDGYVCNFWRAVRFAPGYVGRYADWPANENDLHARHAWLVSQRDRLSRQLEGDPDWYDAKIAGWWAWGVSCWIGAGFCSGKGPWQVVDGQLIHLGNSGQGVHRQRIHLGDGGQGVKKREGAVVLWMNELSERLQNVRVACGSWERVLGPMATFKHGTTGVFLDPPYGEGAKRTSRLYRCDSESIAAEVRQWCMENGDNPLLRIVLCGQVGEHEALQSQGWNLIRWKRNTGYAGYGNGQGRKNADAECLWLSPNCVPSQQLGLFASLDKS